MPAPTAFGPPTPLRPCCGAVKMDAPLQPRGGFRLSLAPDGGPVTPGSRDDVYYVGRRPRPVGSAAPSAYRLVGGVPATLALDLKARYPGLPAVRFPQIVDAAAADSAQQLDALLRLRFGPEATLHRLGRGGQQVAVRVCRQAKGCLVAKVRRLVGAAKDAAIAARDAADALRRDLVMLAVAEALAARARWRGADGTERPFVRVAALGDFGGLRDGVLEQELVPWRPSAELEGLLAGNVGRDGPTRDALWREAPAAQIARPRALAFADHYQKAADLGPELFRLRRFVDDCEALGALPTVAKICAAARRDFHLPADLPARIAGLEQLYRDSAPWVIRLVRQHLGDASANPAADGAACEVGLDLNHGRNVGWDPETKLLVIFDA